MFEKNTHVHRGFFFVWGIHHFRRVAEMATTTMTTNDDHFFAKMITPKVSTLRDVVFFILQQGDALWINSEGITLRNLLPRYIAPPWTNTHTIARPHLPHHLHHQNGTY